MSAAKTVLVVGGGVAGLTLAAALGQKGISCRVIEIGRRDDRLGTGITLLGNTLRALEMVGLADACIEVGYGFDHIVWRDGHGVLQTEFKPPNYFRSDRPGNAGIMRPVLGNILEDTARKAGARIDFETSVESIEQNDDGVRARLSTGEVVQADVLVAADGVYSKTREMVFGAEFKPKYCGQGGWRYTANRPDAVYGITFYRGPSGHALGAIPLSQKICYFFFLDNEQEVTRRPKDLLAEMFKERIAEFTAPELVKAASEINAGSHISYRPFDVMMMPDPWYRGRVVLIGDAAHALSPQLTSGGGMAIEDAVVLADELSKGGDAPAALESFMRRRFERVSGIYQTSFKICLNEQQASPDDQMAMELLKQGHAILAAPF